MSAERLREALAEQGIECDVEANGRLAVLTTRTAEFDWADVAFRATIVAMAADAGFTHVALEIADPAIDAPLPRA